MGFVVVDGSERATDDDDEGFLDYESGPKVSCCGLFGSMARNERVD
jgi:hypothetical protein